MIYISVSPPDQKLLIIMNVFSHNTHELLNIYIFIFRQTPVKLVYTNGVFTTFLQQVSPLSPALICVNKWIKIINFYVLSELTALHCNDRPLHRNSVVLLLLYYFCIVFNLLVSLTVWHCKYTFNKVLQKLTLLLSTASIKLLLHDVHFTVLYTR